jgi:predicted esterase
VPPTLDGLSEGTFFDQPWPNDLRVENGSPRLKGFYNPLGLSILDLYITSMTGVIDGFSPAGAGFLRFTGDIDPTSLPATPRDCLAESAGVQLLDVDPASPEHGQRKLISLQWRAPRGVYYRPDTLAFMPTVGFPLRPHTRYALVVTDALRATDGSAVAQSDTVAMLVGVKPADAATSAAASALADAVGEITSAGIPATSVVHLAVYTTSDPTKELAAVRDGVAQTVPAPTAEPAEWIVAKEAATYTEYQGRYGPSPNYQAGTLPFVNDGDGGNFVFMNGLPVVQSTFDLRFSLTVPIASACPMPANGYPIVLYAHGTGGDFHSYLSDGTGQALAAHCIASMGVDQIFQGTRPGSDPNASEAEIGLTFYNVDNPVAARTNGRQSAIDEVQRARLFTESHMRVPASISVTQVDVQFDATKLMVFGHSQGGLNAPLFTAVDPAPLGGIFSGSGAEISIGLLDKTSPQPAVSSLIATLLGLNNGAKELDVFHPVMALFQTIIDVEDPINYGRLQVAEPRPGFAPRSVYMTEGINPNGTGDSYAPPPGIEAHGLAVGLPLQVPYTHMIEQLSWGGPSPVMVPAAGLARNLSGGRASGILAQWAVPPGSDGHFVVFDVPAAKEQAAQFLQNLAANPAGIVPAP